MNSMMENDALRELRSMWQFPATCKLLSLLCTQLNISAPTPSELEQAIISPGDHVALLSNLHGRLLGVSAGTTAAKRWLEVVAQFVRNYPFDFASILEITGNNSQQCNADDDETKKTVNAIDNDHDFKNKTKEEENGNNNDNSDNIDNNFFVFPSKLEDYIHQLTPNIRLLVLHIITELVLANHDQILTTGSLSNISDDNLRLYHIGKDALSNRYWYFGDAQRLYREPKPPPTLPPPPHSETREVGDSKQRQKQSTIHQKNDISATSAHKDRTKKKPSAAPSISNDDATSRRSRGPNNDSGKTKPRSSRTRAAYKEKRDRLVEDIFGTDDLSHESIGALGDFSPDIPIPSSIEVLAPIGSSTPSSTAREENSGAVEEEGGHIKSNENDDDDFEDSVNNVHMKRKQCGRPASSKKSKIQRRNKSTISTSSSKTTSRQSEFLERRTSGRVRRQPERHGSESGTIASSTRPAKRPRVAEPSQKFTDVSLRQCQKWEMIAFGSEELSALIERFKKGNEGTILSSERTLVTILEEYILPKMEEEEAKARREAERKQKAELLMAMQKRSTRLETITQRRAEKAKRIAEEEEKERLRIKQLEDHGNNVTENLLVAEKEQSRYIRQARRLYGMDDAILRDDGEKVEQQKLEQKQRQQREKQEKQQRQMRDDHNDNDSGAIRRSSRMRQSSRLRERSVGKEEEDSGKEVNGPVSNPNGTEREMEHTTEEKIAKSETNSDHNVDDDIVMKDIKPEDVDEKNNAKNPKLFTSAIAEEEVSDDFTWSVFRLDSLPCRKLNKFFFASRTNLSDISLDVCVNTDDKSGDHDIHQPKQNNIINPTADKTTKTEPEIANGTTNQSTVKKENETESSTHENENETNNSKKEDIELECTKKSEDKDGKVEVVGLGILIPPSLSPPAVVRVEIGIIREWKIRYGREPKLWVRSDYAWYELQDCATEYQSSFASVRRKYELCGRLGILSETMRAPMLGYDNVLHLLSMRYMNMNGYDEKDIIDEKRFIVRQMELHGRKSIVQSGFLKQLSSKIRTEDRKRVMDEEKKKADVEKTAMSKAISKNSIVDEADEKGTGNTSSSKSLSASERTKSTRTPKSGGKKRSTQNGKRPVPRVVSSILSSILRAATKSQTPKRRKKKVEAVSIESNVNEQTHVLNGVISSEPSLKASKKAPKEAGTLEVDNPGEHEAKKEIEEMSVDNVESQQSRVPIEEQNKLDNMVPSK